MLSQSLNQETQKASLVLARLENQKDERLEWRANV
jgi:hypothetical protein